MCISLLNRLPCLQGGCKSFEVEQMLCNFSIANPKIIMNIETHCLFHALESNKYLRNGQIAALISFYLRLPGVT